MSLKDIRKAFLEGRISKNEYVNEMYEFHKLFFAYSEYIQSTDIKNILILNNKVIFTSKNSGVLISCDGKDPWSVPMGMLNFLRYEQEDSDLIYSMITNNDVIFDIGANLGWYAINFKKKFPKAAVYAFEPIPETFQYFLDNLLLNNIHHVHSFNIGLSNFDGLETFYFSSEASVLCSTKILIPNERMREIKCNVQKLDSFVKNKNINRLDFIKCDVEGGELKVLEGGLRTISEFKPIIFLEIIEKWAEKFNYSGTDIINFLKALGYQCFYSKNDKLFPTNSITHDSLSENYFFLNKIKHKDLIIKYSY